MKIFILILLTVSLAACAVVPIGPPPFHDGPYDRPGMGPRGPRIGGPRGHFAPVPILPPPPPFGRPGFPGGHHH